MNRTLESIETSMIHIEIFKFQYFLKSDEFLSEPIERNSSDFSLWCYKRSKMKIDLLEFISNVELFISSVQYILENDDQ